MSRTIPHQPPPDGRWLSPAERARMVPCGQCWRVPAEPCTPDGDHLARWLRAERRGMATQAGLAAAVATIEVIAPQAIIAERAA